MPGLVDEFLKYFGGAAVVLSGLSSAAGVAYWIFRTFSEKWLTSKFEERLAAYKHEQQKELETLKFRISGLLDRTTKLHQREFDVLPEAWAKLVIADGNVRAVTAGLQQYADIDGMNAEQLAEFVESLPFPKWKKEQLRTAPNKSKFYQEAENWRRLGEAKAKYHEFFLYHRKNSVFIRKEINDRFNEISDLIHHVIVEYEFELQHPNADIAHQERLKERRKFASDGRKMLEMLEQIVQARLWDSQVENLAGEQKPVERE